MKTPDIYIISYPKSGRTWLRMLIGRYLCLAYNAPMELILKTEILTNSVRVPVIGFDHDNSQMLKKLPYYALSSDKSNFIDKKVVFLARNLKDTIVSAYFQATKRIQVFQGSISDFIRTDEYGIRKLITFYNQWMENSVTPTDFLYVAYEEMHADTGQVLHRVLEFAGMKNIHVDLIQQSVDFCEFENMRKMERQNALGDSRLAPSKVKEAESYKVQRAR